jgi:cytochrome bd-type quinol oxidase subunit 2
MQPRCASPGAQAVRQSTTSRTTRRFELWKAASSPPALKVILIGVAISVPAIAGYTVFSYRVFGGKASELRYA